MSQELLPESRRKIQGYLNSNTLDIEVLLFLHNQDLYTQTLSVKKLVDVEVKD